MNLTIVSTLIAFLLGITVGFFIGVGSIIGFKRAYRDMASPKFEKKIDEKLKVLHKSEPKTFDEKRSEAIDKDKPIIKTFRK